MDLINDFYKVPLPDPLTVASKMQDAVTDSAEGLRVLATSRIVVLMAGDSLFLSADALALLKTIEPLVKPDERVFTRAELPSLTTMISDERYYRAT